MRTATAKILKPGQRAKLKARTAPYCASIAPKRLLGYIKTDAAIAGRWVVQVEIGRSEVNGQAMRRRKPLGVADDLAAANGLDILSYEQALAAAVAWKPVAEEKSVARAFTVRDAVEQHRNYGGKQ